MNSLIKTSPEELINKLKVRKNEIMKEEEEANRLIKEFYIDLKNRVEDC